MKNDGITDSDFEKYLSGKSLYGDDFTQHEIDKWFDDEENAYRDLKRIYKQISEYEYHESNMYHGFRYLPNNITFDNVLGFGSGRGDEFKPILKRINNLTIVESSDSYAHDQIGHIHVSYEKPTRNGRMPFENEKFSLITCFGVLHHIPNVSFVLTEIFRCLQKGGYLLLREPIVSMGDWRLPRAGLTKRERGISAMYIDSLISNFDVISRRFFMFPGIGKIAAKKNVAAYNSYFLTRLDFMLAYFTQFNTKYHRKNIIEKIGPNSLYYVLRKKSD